ncbi:UBX domain-containing protein [Lachnellula willkommii]|uniref:UBX domain-containing protein n=1 Tax=Lachnellula willkommii TaxID=215461 RepID=A0A559M4J7_9HELO|nr:UBX domain-containing protein [Lachnellula willkommii]
MATPETDISELSESQQLALQTYTSVTDQDVQAAIPLLQRSQWNVEIAIAKFFDGEGPDPVAEALAAQTVPPPQARRQENLQQSLLRGPSGRNSPNRPDAAPRIVPQSADQLVPRPSLILAILYKPFQLLYKLFSLPLNFLAYLFPFLPRLFRRDTTSGTVRRRVDTSGRKPLNPDDAELRVQREFAEEYGDNELPWSNKGYAACLDQAKRDYGFLLVILLSPEHDETSSFCSEVLMNAEVTQFLRDPVNRVTLWVGDVRDSEAYQVSTALKCNKFPFTALICQTPEVSSTAMSVVARSTGPTDARTYLAELRPKHAARSETLETSRQAQVFQNAERNLRQEQESAYERSLAQDREKARLKREAEAAVAAAEKAKLQEELDAADFAAKKEQWRRWRASEIKVEPSADEKDVVRIALKMPEAARIMRRFRASDSMLDLYDFVECYEYLQDGGSSEKVPEKPENYEHEYKFRLVSTLPRVVYEAELAATIGDKVGRNGNLIVEPIAEDDDEE